jgi:DNA polymerase (family 10)
MTNLELAAKLKDLRDFLIIAGYEESHALRYTQIARSIEKLPEPVENLAAEGRLCEIPQVGKLIAQYITEILQTGTSSKQQEWESEAPITVLEMVRVPGLGAKTARKLFQEHKIATIADLKLKAESGELSAIPGIGPKMVEAVTNHQVPA